jgi:hypothetical protein
LLALLLLVLSPQQGEIVEGSLGLGGSRGLRAWWSEALNGDMFLTPLLDDIGGAKADALQPDLQEAEIEGIEAQFNLAADKLGIDPVGIALQLIRPSLRTLRFSRHKKALRRISPSAWRTLAIPAW